MVALAPPLTISWELLPDDYILPDDPVDNIAQPLLAAALQESLELAGLLSPEQIIATNFGICTKVNGNFVIKAPDWVYVPQVKPFPPYRTRRSYTPHKEGVIPLIVMEFLSDTDGGEYSLNPRPPYGKMWFYERILHVPIYAIFEPEIGQLEVYRLIEDRYQLLTADAQNRYWFDEMNLYFGVWDGCKVERQGYWLRWWDAQGNILPWGIEKVEQQRQLTEQQRQLTEQQCQLTEQQHQLMQLERLRADQEHERAERLAAKLKELGITLDEL
ncbi:MAG: Uma2 family endonuclease [Microcystaceae cyanobacterium]